jgi:hypothetical protein
MTLAPKNCIIRNKSFDFCFHKYNRIIQFLLVMMPLYFLLPTVSQAAPKVSKTPSANTEVCSAARPRSILVLFNN